MSIRPGTAAIARRVRWSLFAFAFGLAALALAWRLLAAVDFAYPVLYDLLDIGATIERFGPENEVRPGFQRTGRAERERVFGAIVDAIRDHGRGLEELRYVAPDGDPIGPLLTPAEITHLNDVAALVAGFERLGRLALVVLVVMVAAAAARRERPPRARAFALGGAAIVGIGTLATFAVGPVDLFYWLHEQVFPPDHQWFFHYQESLMSMMMRAPDLFGAIAVIWLVLTLVVGATIAWGIGWLLQRRAATSGH